MSLMIGPAFTIAGYTTTVPPDYDTECDATVYTADALLGCPAFWSEYLIGPVGLAPSQAGFAVDAQDLQAMQDVLYDPERWPAVSVRLDGDAWLRIVYRNFDEDAGMDFVQVRPGRPVTVFDVVQDRGCSPTTWDDLLEAARLPDERMTWAQRLILMLPLLDPQELPADAVTILDRALAGIGASNTSASATALVRRLDWRG